MVISDVPIERDTLRLRSEFLEMPGLIVTVPQAARMCGLRLDHAADILNLLEREGFLTHDDAGAYRRVARRSDDVRGDSARANLLRDLA